jgi:hypothetical protein
MFFYKDKAFEQGIEYIQESLTKMKEEYNSLKSSLIPEGIKIQQIQNCLRITGSRRGFISYYETDNNSYGKNSIEKVVQLATNDYNKLKNEVEELHKTNLPNLEINKKIYNHVCKLFESIGIYESYTTYEYPSNRSHKKKEITHTSGYLTDLYRNCITNDGYEQAIKDLEIFKSQIDKYAIDRKQLEYNEQIKKEQELRKQKEVKEAINILDKYKKVIGVDYTLETAVNLAEELQMDEEHLFSKYALNIINDEFDGVEIIEINLTGEWRHGVNKEIIVQSTITKKYYICYYQDSPKESMDLQDMNPSLEFNELPNYIRK